MPSVAPMPVMALFYLNGVSAFLKLLDFPDQPWITVMWTSIFPTIACCWTFNPGLSPAHKSKQSGQPITMKNFQWIQEVRNTTFNHIFNHFGE